MHRLLNSLYMKKSSQMHAFISFMVVLKVNTNLPSTLDILNTDALLYQRIYFWHIACFYIHVHFTSSYIKQLISKSKFYGSFPWYLNCLGQLLTLRYLEPTVYVAEKIIWNHFQSIIFARQVNERQFVGPWRSIDSGIMIIASQFIRATFTVY